MGRASRKAAAATLRKNSSSRSASRQKNFKELEKEKLNVIYVTDTDQAREIAKEIEELSPESVGLDFETASKNGRYGVDNGSLRLIQIGIDKPKPVQIVLDCFRASPKPLLPILRNPEIEKQIHNMGFEQEWSQVQLGARIQNVYDTCIAFRVIQEHLRGMSEEELQSCLPGWHQHDNRLFTLMKIYMDMEMPKAGQSSDWSREKLLPEQIRYAAMDSAVMPLLTEQVKKIAKHVGCEEAIQEKITKEDKRINERMRAKKRNDQDDSVRIERALSRAASVEELDRLWQSRPQMTVFSDNISKIQAAYKKRRAHFLDRKR